MKNTTSSQLTPEQQAELAALAALPDEQIDTQDTPELSGWSGKQRGLFYRPVKQQITLRLDADVIAWFKYRSRAEKGKGYQTYMNNALREYVREHMAEE